MYMNKWDYEHNISPTIVFIGVLLYIKTADESVVVFGFFLFFF